MKKVLISIASIFVVAIVAVSVYIGISNQPHGTSSSWSGDTMASDAIGNEKNAEMLQSVSEPLQNGSYFKQTNGYQDLDTPAMQQLYSEIEKSVGQISQDKNEKGTYPLKEIVINQPITFGEIRKALVAFQYDHPNVFWIAKEYHYTYNDSQGVIQLYSYVSKDACTEMQEKLNQKIDEVVRRIPSGLSEMDREMAVCKIMEDTCVYDDAAVKNTDVWESYTVYGALINGRAVCQGYAKSVQLLLSYMNMECQLVNGNADGTLHMWNLVKVDGNWYHLDVTWIDNENISAYEYFNLTDKQIRYDHTISPTYSEYTDQQLSDGAVFNLTLPSCISDYANYMKQTQIFMNGTDSHYDKEIVDGIVKELESGKDSLYFTVNASLDLNETVDQMFQKSPYKFIDYVKAANKQLRSDKRIDYNNCKYTVDHLRRYIKVKIAFQQ